MRNPAIHILLSVVTSLVLSTVATADVSTWISVMGDAMEEDDFDALVCSQQVRNVEWPAIYSSNTAARLDVESPGVAETNATLYGLALTFSEQLDDYAPSLDSMNDTNLEQRIGFLLEIRGKVQAEDGLINILVSDAISRVLLVTLADRFGDQSEHSDWVYEGCTNTLHGACEIDWIVDAFAIEDEWPPSTVSQIKAMDADAAARQISEEIGSTIETVLSPYGSLQNVGLYTLLSQNAPNLLLVFHRSIKTQTLLRTLQLGCDYKKDAASFSLDATAADIDAVLPQAGSRYTYTLTPSGMTRATNTSLDMSGWCVEEQLSRSRFTGRHVQLLFYLIDGGPLAAQRLFTAPQ